MSSWYKYYIKLSTSPYKQNYFGQASCLFVESLDWQHMSAWVHSNIVHTNVYCMKESRSEFVARIATHLWIYLCYESPESHDKTGCESPTGEYEVAKSSSGKHHAWTTSWTTHTQQGFPCQLTVWMWLSNSSSCSGWRNITYTVSTYSCYLLRLAPGWCSISLVIMAHVYNCLH